MEISSVAHDMVEQCAIIRKCVHDFISYAVPLLFTVGRSKHLRQSAYFGQKSPTHISFAGRILEW